MSIYTADQSALATPVQAYSMSYNTQQTGPNRPSVRRITVNTYPNTNINITSTMSNRVYRFGINAEGFLDGKNSYLKFDLQATGAGTIELNDISDSFMSRVSLYSNSGVFIEDVQQYTLLASALKHEISNNYAESVGKVCLNMNLTVGQQQAKSVVKNTYIVEFIGSGFLNAFNLLPCRALANTQSYAYFIEVEFASAANIMKQTGGTDGAYTISNCVYVADVVYDDVKEAEISAMLSNNPLVIHFPTWKAHTNALNAGSTINNIIISEFQESIEELMVVFKLQTNINNIATYTPKFDLPNVTDTIKSFQLKIGNFLYPVQNLTQLTNVAQQYYEYTKSTGKNKCYDEGNYPLVATATGRTDAETTSYVIRYPLRIMPTDSLGDDTVSQYFYGINTRTTPTSIILNLDCGAVAGGGLTTNYSVQSFVKYDVSLVIMKSESYIVS